MKVICFFINDYVFIWIFFKLGFLVRLKLVVMVVLMMDVVEVKIFRVMRILIIICFWRGI